jgi:hypothetical protein
VFGQPQPKECEGCDNSYQPRSSFQRACSPRCAKRVIKADKAKQKQEVKQRKAALLTIPKLLKVAQREFNSFIRERDKEQPCICCGVPFSYDSVGGRFDCGHYRSVGSAGHLRFNEHNAHGQRKYCNRHGAGRAVDYRSGLIARIGLAAVEALENDNHVHKWTKEELIDIAATYRAKRRELEKANR